MRVAVINGRLHDVQRELQCASSRLLEYGSTVARNVMYQFAVIGSPGKRPSRLRGPRKNNFAFWHHIFTPSLAAPQSQNPQRSPATPAVSLNRCGQI